MKKNDKPKIFGIKKQGPKHTRRDFLKGSLVAGGAAISAGMLNACDKDDERSDYKSFYGNTMEHGGEIHKLVFSNDSKILASCADDALVKLWTITDKVSVKVLEMGSRNHQAIAFNHNNSKFLTGSSNWEIKQWELPSANLLNTLESHSGSIFDLQFRPDGKQFLSTAMDDNLKIWNTDDCTVLHTFTGHYSADFSNDGKWLLGKVYTNGIVLYNTDNYTVEKTFEARNAILSPDSKNIIIVGFDGKITVINLTDFSEQITIEPNDSVYELHISSDGKTLITPHITDISIWSLTDGTLVKKINNNANQLSIDFKPDSNIFAIGQNPGTIQLWSTHGELLNTLEPEDDSFAIGCLAFSPDGKIIAVAFSDQKIRLWKLPENEPFTIDEFCTCNTVCACHTISTDSGSDVCTCNTIEGCQCNSVCECNSVGNGGGSYYYPN